MKNPTLSTSELKLTNSMDASNTNISGDVEEEAVIHLQGLGSNDFTLMEDDVMKPLSTKDQIKKFGSWVKHKIKRSWSKKVLFRRLPILGWLPVYNSQDAVGDLVAGITVGLTVIPQALAYSNIAGLPAEYGLYGAFLGALLYIILGSCKDVPMGPTAIVSLLTYQATHGLEVEYAIFLCFTSGLIQLLMGILGLGFVIDFVSGPVSSGFTSAVALIIVTSQVKDVLGIKGSGNTFLEMWISLFKNMADTRLWDTVLGVGCITVLLGMRLLASLELGPKDTSKKTCAEKTITKIFWMIGTSRNAILVLICGILGYFFVSKSQAEIEKLKSDNTTLANDVLPSLEEAPFLLIGSIPKGLPEFKVPPFGFESHGTWISVIDMMSELKIHMIVLPLIGLLENIAICRVFSSGRPVDATQELIAMGICNIGNSFVQGFPGSGSLSRSAVNEASGVRTPLGGLYTGVAVIVALLFFTPYFYFIPKATLAAVIIAAVVFMVEVKVVKPMWRTKKSDLVPGFGTFIACLVLRLEYGIALGIIIQILFLLYNAARPKIHMQKIRTKSGIEYLRLTPDRCLIFPSVDYVRNIVTKHSIKQGIPVVIDCSHIYGADFTAAKVLMAVLDLPSLLDKKNLLISGILLITNRYTMLTLNAHARPNALQSSRQIVIETLSRDFVQRKQPLLFYNLKESVVGVFEGLQPQEFVTFYEHDDLDELLRQKVCEKENC